MSIPITLLPGTIPPGLCFANDQDRYNFFIAQTTAFLAGNINGVNIGNSEPAVNDRDKPWMRLNSDGSPDRWYVFYSGQWLWPNPELASSSIRRIWVGNLTDLMSYDGGDNAAVTATTGPMWQEATEFRFALPIGVGTNSVTYDSLPATSIAVQGTLGEEKHLLLQTELPATPLHVHLGQATATGQATNATGGLAAWNNSGAQPVTDNMGSGISHQNMPPCYGVYFIERSQRVFYRAL